MARLGNANHLRAALNVPPYASPPGMLERYGAVVFSSGADECEATIVVINPSVQHAGSIPWRAVPCKWAAPGPGRRDCGKPMATALRSWVLEQFWDFGKGPLAGARGSEWRFSVCPGTVGAPPDPLTGVRQQATV